MNVSSVDRVLGVVVAAMLVLTLLSMGMGLTLSHLWGTLRRGRLLALAFVTNFALVPLAMLGVLALLDPAPATALGLLLCATAPGGGIGTLLVDHARGDLAVGVALLFGLTVASAVVTPPLMSLLSGSAIPGGTAVSVLAMVQVIALLQLGPLCIGLAIRWRRPGLAERLRPWVSKVAMWLLLGVIAGYTATRLDLIRAASLEPLLGGLLGTCAAFLSGWGAWRLVRPERIALALTNTVRNLALALLLATRWFDQPETVITVLYYGLFMTGGGLLAASWFRWRRPPASPPVAAGEALTPQG